MTEADKRKRHDVEPAFDRKLAQTVLAGGRLQGLLLELWQRTRMDWGFVTDRLSTVFRREKWLGAQERRFVSETIYGMVRHVRRIDLALQLGSRRTASPRDLDRMIGYFVLTGALDARTAASKVPAIDWAAAAAVDDAIARERNPSKRLALAASLPDWLAERLVRDWGDDATALAEGLNQRAPMTVRANTLVGDRDALATTLAKDGIETTPGRFAPNALHLATRTNIFGLESFSRGAMEAQDEGSQLLAELAVPSKPGTVVDLCAGAGGKTLALAAAMKNQGRIVASDIDEPKLEELRRRARRAGVSNAQAVALGEGGWPPALQALMGKADVVLVDAPCSGVGALRRNPEARWRLRATDITDFATRQREILGRALQLCRPGGTIVYATCTILREENEDVVAAMLATAPDLRAVPLAEHWASDPARAAAFARGTAFTCTPHQHGTDGFFAQVLRRT